MIFRRCRNRRRRRYDQAYGVLVTGIGGTGVVTIGQILAMAAHVEGKGVTVLDMSGLAQKGGPVMSHVRIAEHPEDLHAARIGTGEASLVIGCDLVVAASPDALAKMSAAQDARGDQRHHRADRGFRAQPELAASGQQSAARHRRSLRQEQCGLPCCRQRFHQPDGRLHRHQYVHARLCLAEGLGAGFKQRSGEGDRAERRLGRIQPEELRLGPARRGRSRARGKDRHAGRGHSASASICRATSTSWWRAASNS